MDYLDFLHPFFLLMKIFFRNPGSIAADGYDFTQGKTDKPMRIPLTDRLAAYLETVRKERLTVVYGRHGRPADYRTITDEMRKVKKRMKHPEAERYVTHGLRKNATIELYQACGDDRLVQAVTGHSSIERLKKYPGQVRQHEFAKLAQEARNRLEQNKKRT